MLKKLLLLPIVGLGVLAVVLMVKGKKAPEVRGPEELATTVRVVEVPRLTVRPHAIGYGEARPGRVWQAVPQVGGRIVELSRGREGRRVRRRKATSWCASTGRTTTSRSQVAEARLAALAGATDETETREKTSAPPSRSRSGRWRWRRRSSSASATRGTARPLREADLDREERSVLDPGASASRRSRTPHPARARSARCSGPDRTGGARTSRRRSLAVERTVIRAPFDCRIGPVNVEQDQVVQPGQVLFSADGTDTTEVTAWLPMRGIRQILSARTARASTSPNRDGGVPGARSASTAEIRLGIGAPTLVRWRGRGRARPRDRLPDPVARHRRLGARTPTRRMIIRASGRRSSGACTSRWRSDRSPRPESGRRAPRPRCTARRRVSWSTAMGGSCADP